MDVKIITDGEYVKGATLELLPSELLLVQAAMWEFRFNKSRNFDDRLAANRMYRRICDAMKGADRKTEPQKNCDGCRDGDCYGCPLVKQTEPQTERRE